jgi:hypothetical protein
VNFEQKRSQCAARVHANRAALFFCPAGESSQPRALRIIEQQIYIILLYPPLTHADISGRTKGQLKNKKQLWRTSGVAGIRKTKTDRETLCFSEFFICVHMHSSSSPPHALVVAFLNHAVGDGGGGDCFRSEVRKITVNSGKCI